FPRHPALRALHSFPTRRSSDLGGVLPVKTDSRSLARKLKSLKRCRQRPGNSVKQGRWLSLAILLTRLFAGSPLFRFDLLPVSQYFSRVSRAGLDRKSVV